MPAAAARSTARLDGAPTAATIGMPAASAFCTSSKLARPLSISTPVATGSFPASSRRPTSLSTALWRPTSSCTAISAPSGENSAAACSPPVRSKVACAARSAPGQSVDHRCGHARIAPGGGRAAAREPVEVGAAADPARRAGDERAGAGRQRRRGRRPQLDADGVVADLFGAAQRARRPPARPPRAGSRPPARRRRRACASSSTAPARRRRSAPGSAAAARSRPDRAPRS